MSAPSFVVRPVSLSLPLLALLVAGAPGCSTTGESLGPVTGYVADGGEYDEGGPEEDADSGSDPSGDETGADDGAGGSTGGDEPAPEPDDDGLDHGAEEPEDACDAEADVSLYLSPDDSNSMSSPVRAREAVLGGWGSVQSVAIRTWEFFNYYEFGYPAAEAGTLAVSPSLRPLEDAAGEYLLQIGVSSEAITAEARPPINVTLVLDTSGSMEGEAMEMLKATCHAIAASLKAGDAISMVTWNTENAIVLGGYHVQGPDDPTLLAEIDALEASGGTDLHAGLVAGYDLAQQAFASDRINRVVLVSDGGANVGITDLELIAQHSGAGNEHGIYMVGVGVGDAASYHDDLMDMVTDAGKGASVFVASADEAWSTFHDDFIGTMAVAARDVQVRLDMPPGFEIVRTSAEEVSTDANQVEPQHLAPNDAMVFHQHVRTCAPQLVTDDATITVTVSWTDAASFEPRQVQHVASMAELFAADPAPLLKGAAVLTYAESLKAYKQADADGRVATMTGAFTALERAEVALPGDPELAEIRDVLEALSE